MSALTPAGRGANQAAAFKPTINSSPEESTPGQGAHSGALTPSGLRLAILDSTARQQQFMASADAANTATDSPADDALLSLVELAFQQSFADSAQDPEAFHALMRESFGDDYDVQAAETIRQQTLAGDFSWMPRVEFVDPQVLGGGNGAYDAANDRILLRSDLKSGELASAVFSEEVGHVLDAHLNTSDTVGDEGELFQMLLAGESPDRAERLRLLRDDDHGQIVVDGELVDVEYSWWSDNVTDPWNEHVVDPIVEHVVDPIVEHVVDPIVEHVVDPINEHLVQPVVTLFEDGLEIVEDVVKFPFEYALTIYNGAEDFVSAVFQGEWSEAGHALVDTAVDFVVLPFQQTADTSLQLLHAGTVFLESVLGQTEQRDLTAEEIALLRPIYGDSVDYGSVQIHTGGIRESLDMRAHVVGNDIFMPEDSFDADGNLTVKGAETFTHEFGHVWQYQNRGSSYLSNALYYQNTQGSGGVGTGEAYDWVANAEQGKHFDDMNVESQAELAAFIGLSIDPATGEVDRGLLETAIRDARAGDIYDDTFVVSDDLFGIVQEAHDTLREG